MTRYEFLDALLKLIGKYELHDVICWDENAENFWVNMNDVFGIASSDAEDITPESLPDLASAIKEIDGAPYGGCILYAARRRKTRPLSRIGRVVLEAFDASGDPR